MDAAEAVRVKVTEPVAVYNRDGSGTFIVTCDHASNLVPSEFGGLGLRAADLLRHIAWDPGAIGVARVMSRALDAPLVCGGVSRLVIDCNRPIDAPDLIAVKSEATTIPGNSTLTPKEFQERISRFYDPYHAEVEAAVTEKCAGGALGGLIAVHSFNPVYEGVSRPWEIGIIHDDDDAWAQCIIDRLRSRSGLNVGVNEPYSPEDRVYYTLERHARSRGLPAVMIEIRNDEIADQRSQQSWGNLLAEIVGDAYKELANGAAGASAAGA